MQERPPAPAIAPAAPAAPATPAAPAAPAAQAPTISIPGGTSASAVYEALKAQRTELRNQLEGLEDKRRDLSQRLEEPMVNAADRKGIEQRITEVDQTNLGDRQADRVRAKRASRSAAAVPGAVVERREPPRQGPPEEVVHSWRNIHLRRAAAAQHRNGAAHLAARSGHDHEPSQASSPSASRDSNRVWTRSRSRSSVLAKASGTWRGWSARTVRCARSQPARPSPSR